MLTVRLESRRGTPVLLVDDQPTAPVIFCGVPDADPDTFSQTAALLAQEGVHLYTAFVGDVVWCPTPAEEQAQFDRLDAMMARLVAADPQALFMPRFGTEPKWWVKAHPEEAAHWGRGHVAEEASVGSARWRAELTPKLEAYVRWFEDHWGDHVLGYQPCACGESYFMYWWNSAGELPGFDPRFAARYRHWLQQRYVTIDRLNAAWRTTHPDFAVIPLPTEAERWAAPNGLLRRLPAEQPMVDFTRFSNEVVYDVLHDICATVKSACDHRKLTIICYGYLFEMSGNWHGTGCGPIGHCATAKVLDDPVIDAILAPVSYADRKPGGAVPWMGPVDTPPRLGKAWASEIDIRTHLSDPKEGFSRCATPEETEWVHTQAFAQALTHRTLMWFMDMGGPGGWLQSERIARTLGRYRQVYERLYESPAPFESDVVAVVDEEAHLRMAYDAGWLLGPALFLDLRREINRLGAPPAWRLQSEFLADNAPLPRLALMLNAFCLSAAQRQALRRRLAGSGATVVWFYAPGYLDDGVAGMTELTGFEFEVTHDPAPIRVVTTGCESPLLAGVNRATFPEDSDSPIMVGAPPSRAEIQKQHVGTRRVAPRFAVRASQPGNEVVARFEDGAIAIARRQEDGFTSVYIGTFWAPAQLLANIAADAGVHRYVKPGTIVTTDGRFLAVTSEAGGPTTVRLRARSRVEDPLDGSIVAVAANVLQLKLQPGQTRLMELDGRKRA